MSDSEEYNVERIVDVKGAGKAKKFLIKWEGYDEEDNTWEPAAHLDKRLIADFEAAQKKGAGTSAATKKRAAASDNDDDDDDDDDESDGEYVPEPKDRSSKSPAVAERKGKAPAAPGASAKKVTPKTAGAKRPAAAIDWSEAPPSADLICSALATMDAAGLKAFAAALGKEGFPLKAASKKEQVYEDLCVVVRATYEGLCLVQASSYNQHGLVEPGKFESYTEWRFDRRSGLKDDVGPAAFSTERVRSCAWGDLGWPWNETFNRQPRDARVAKLEGAWARAAAGDASKKPPSTRRPASGPSRRSFARRRCPSRATWSTGTARPTTRRATASSTPSPSCRQRPPRRFTPSTEPTNAPGPPSMFGTPGPE
jgi:hypothetical protein